jgi:hypothetical protein
MLTHETGGDGKAARLWMWERKKFTKGEQTELGLANPDPFAAEKSH